MFVFIKTLSDRLRPAGRMLVMDGQPEKLSTEASKYIDHYIYQRIGNVPPRRSLGKSISLTLKTGSGRPIITVEFEQGWQTGGVDNYTSVRPEINAYPEGVRF